jgi:dTDP-4-dehydrorhamnose 3,5-epimerase
MNAKDVTAEWLRTIDFRVHRSVNQPTIRDVVARDLHANLDGRGEVTELWSRPWVEGEALVMPQHVYQSATDCGVVKCWHLHDVHTDQLICTRGKLQITLVDLRADCPSFGHVNTFILGTLRPRLIKIPPMVMHGWKALSAPEVIVVNLQSHVYSAADEFKLPWDCVLADVWEPRNG